MGENYPYAGDTEHMIGIAGIGEDGKGGRAPNFSTDSRGRAVSFGKTSHFVFMGYSDHLFWGARKGPDQFGIGSGCMKGG